MNRKIKNTQQELTLSNQRIAELTQENKNLNSLVVQDEKTREKWLNSYKEMEEIVQALDCKKQSMQEQLTKMQQIVESNNEEIFQLTEINQHQEIQNQLLIQEVFF